MDTGFQLRPTPFHARMAEHNRGNAWVARGGFSLPAHFGAPLEEMLAARVSAILFDASHYQRLRVHGAGATAFLSMALGCDAGAIPTGHSRPVIWRGEAGGLRGNGLLARFGENNYVLSGFTCDTPWFAAQAPRFHAVVRDETPEKGILALGGPYAAAVMKSAGFAIADDLLPGMHRAGVWGDIPVLVSRWSPLGGFEITCAPEDGTLVFDRLWNAGRNFGLMPAGQEAVEALLLEAGVVLAEVDYTPARTAFAAAPDPAMLGMSHAPSAQILRGILLDADHPAPFAPVLREGRTIGATRRSAYSPALCRAIALAQIDASIEPGTTVRVSGIINGKPAELPARIVTLPFLT
jgi:aminomethyltransferase